MDFNKRILIITNHYPDMTGGGSLASRTIINSFASLFRYSTLIYPDNGKPVGHLFLPGIKTIPNNDPRPKWFKGLEVYTGRLHRFERCVVAEIKSNKPDILIFDTSIVSLRIIEKAVRSGIRIITVHHNVEVDFIKDNPPSIVYRFPYSYFLVKSEREAVIASKLNLTLTEHDRIRLSELYKRDILPIITCMGVSEPYTAGIKQLPEFSGENKKNPRFVISGDLSYPQSDISIRNFIETLWPIVKNRFENPELVITGKKPTAKLARLCAKFKEISLIGNPDNIFKIVAGCDFYLCPVDRGSGFKFRIMDGLKLGLPAIVHRVAAQGYEDFSEKGFMSVYDSPGSFNESISNICFKSIDYRQLKYVYTEKFSFERGVKRLEDILNKTDL
jgi:hypothetical protein